MSSLKSSQGTIKHYNIRVHGMVQGVGFRWATMKKAQGYHLKGFVKNEPNGSLYIEAEGEDHHLEYFVMWCHKGPLWARVESVEVFPGPLKNFYDFEITK